MPSPAARANSDTPPEDSAFCGIGDDKCWGKRYAGKGSLGRAPRGSGVGFFQVKRFLENGETGIAYHTDLA